MSSVHVYVGSLNPVKVQAVQEAFSKIYPTAKVTAIPCKADPGISEWRSQNAIGQPFGLAQTRQGAVNRMRFCVDEASNSTADLTFAVGLENGLVPPSELGKSGILWFDGCITAVCGTRDSHPEIVHQGTFVQTEFACPEGADQGVFDTAVVKYEAEIMPRIQKGEDLYFGWTTGHTGGPFTRVHFLIESLMASHAERELQSKAFKIIDICAQSGMAASAGPRYRHMLWTRDLAYMAPAYLKRGYRPLLFDAVRKLSSAQCSIHIQHDSGYGPFDRFGQIPIVLVAPEDELAFLRQRIQGTLDDPFWSLQLLSYCQAHRPESVSKFPQPPLDTVDGWREYYTTLTVFRDGLSDPDAPKASFALRSYMNDALWNLTPGTRDSEIQFLRTIVTLGPEALTEFAVPVARALRFVYSHVLDPDDGLPYGADSRDIFADLLVDAKLLSNAVFWYQVVRGLLTHSETLRNPVFLKELGASPCVVSALEQLVSNPIRFLTMESHRLTNVIQHQLLCRDFIPGERALLGMDNPIHPTPVTALIREFHPSFPDGLEVDPQGLAYAVLAGLVPREDYDDVCTVFRHADSEVGIRVFVPISGKSSEENKVMHRAEGRVNWPHIAWVAVRALRYMDTVQSRCIAEEQRRKLVELGGCAEWYALGPVAGGDEGQGWSASGVVDSMF
jgi:hypothetical protein